jgi:hypothetical protein
MRGHCLQTFRAVIISINIPTINVVLLSPPPGVLLLLLLLHLLLLLLYIFLGIFQGFKITNT